MPLFYFILFIYILPLISIIINCFNGERFLRTAIDSVYNQDFDDWEIIFWDNASTDDSALIAKSYGRQLKYYSNKKTTSLGKARNMALKMATGKYIAFLDCDDVFLPGKLRKQVSQMEGNNFALSYSDATVIDEFNRKIRKIKTKNNSGYIFGNLLRHYEIVMASVMIRRQVLEKEGFEFAEELKYCPDYNLFMKIASCYTICVINDNIVNYRRINGSLSSQSVDIASSEIKFTLDYIFSSNPELKSRFHLEAAMAYDKLHYYDSVAKIYDNNKLEARKHIIKVIFKRWQYFLLYLLLLLPFPTKIILMLLRR